MKLVYTDIRNPLTPILAKEAADLATDGKRVFYIAPNSLSFEKERSVLEVLDGQASFAITVTRFVQMARYLVLNDSVKGRGLDDVALGMLFYKVLSSLEPQDLRVFTAIKLDPAFIQQLVDLYHELKTAQMTVSDLEFLESPEKRADLLTIFLALEKELQAQDFRSSSPVSDLIAKIEAGQVETDLTQIALVIDGFTRFSAEEEALVGLLHRKGASIVVGAYSSPKAFKAGFIEGTLYQASVEFLRHLAQQFACKPVYIPPQGEEDAFAPISRMFESRYDFSQSEEGLPEQSKQVLHLWNKANQKEEVETVARSIRQKVHDGARYKDFRLLLGDVESYQLQLKTIFDQYEIPFYLGRSESMASHPLVQLVESLERLKRYNFRREDLLNLLKTGLYGQFSQEEVDQFELYVHYADIKGASKFGRDFTVNDGQKFNLERLNHLRSQITQPLFDFFKARSQSANSLLKKFTAFLEEISLMSNLETLLVGESQSQAERQDEVWKAFCHILEQVDLVFAASKLAVDDFLALLRSSILLANYRTVPATVDVVLVQSYDLIEPMASPYVYAIGLTQGNFPKIAQNVSLLSDEERQVLNEASSETSQLMISSQENLKKNHFTAISLLNAAQKELFLSVPQMLRENEDTLSPYIKEILALGFDFERQSQQMADDIGSYRGLLSRLVELHQSEIEAEWSPEEKTFWTVAGRVLRRKLAEEGLSLPIFTGRPKSQPLKAETLDVLYPQDQPLELSTSSLTEFYRHQYSYFLKYVLRLEELGSVHPDARAHGNFLHRIFELTLQDTDSQTFDQRLEEAIRETKSEASFKAMYEEDNESRLARDLLVETARSTAQVLKSQERVTTLAEEWLFGADQTAFLTLDQGHKVVIKGKVDRIDRLQADGAVGVVDYKSGAKNFDYKDFFNGLNSQLVTYLAALKQAGLAQSDQIFGAMYLHMTEPQVKLADTKEKGEILAQALKELDYKGLFIKDKLENLQGPYEKNAARILTQEELQLLLIYNEQLYRLAAQQLLRGHFAINPYTEDGRSIAPYVEQHKAITGFEANHHLGQARQLEKLQQPLRGEKQKQAWLDKIKEALENEA